MGDQMRFFASLAPQPAKGKATKPDGNAPEYLWPGYRGPDQAGWTQMDHVNRMRENLYLMRSADKTQAVGLWAQMDLESTEKEPDVTTQEKPVFQTKLTISEPDDRLEKEADEVADRVMRSPTPANLNRPAISPFARSLQKYTLPDSLRDETGAPKPNPLLGKRQRSKGNVLPESSREFFGNRFGRSFDSVRVHIDQAAHDAADSIQAKAFTHGNDIYFNKDQYSPGTNEGDRLIAHELTHVVQQSGGQGAIQREPEEELSNQQEATLATPSIQREPKTLEAATRDQAFFDIEAAISYNSTEHKANIELLKKINQIAQDPLRFAAAKSNLRTGAEFALLVRSAQMRLYPNGPASKLDGKLGPETIRLGEKWIQDNPASSQESPGIFEQAMETLKRLGYLKDAIVASMDKFWPSIKKEVGEAAEELLAGLAAGLIIGAGILAMTTLIGAIAGAFFGGAGAAPGAVLGLKAGLFILQYLGIGFLIAWLGSRAVEIGYHFWQFISRAWNSGGDQKAIQGAANSFASSIGVFIATSLEVLVTFGVGKGIAVAGNRLKGTRFAKWIGENRLMKWFRNRVRRQQRDFDKKKHEEIPTGELRGTSGDELIKDFNSLRKGGKKLTQNQIEKLLAASNRGLRVKKLPSDKKLWELSVETGVEWATYEALDIKWIRSGTRTSVNIPIHASVKNLTHTQPTSPIPSLQDYRALLSLIKAGSSERGLRIISSEGTGFFNLELLRKMHALGQLKSAAPL